MPPLTVPLPLSPEEVEETENLDGQADDRVPREDEEETNRKNDGSPQLGALSNTNKE